MGHFPEDMRFVLILESFNKAIKGYKIDKMVIEKIIDGSIFAMHWFNIIKDSSYDLVSNYNNRSEEDKRYINEVNEYWDKELYNKLKEYSWINLYDNNN